MIVPRIGWDFVTLYAVIRFPELRKPDWVSNIIAKSLGYERDGEPKAIPAKRSIYRSLQTLRNLTDPNALLLDVITQPTTLGPPDFRLKFRSSMQALVDLTEAARLTQILASAIEAELKSSPDYDSDSIPSEWLIPSEAELTIDLPKSLIRSRQLFREMYAPWSGPSRSKFEWSVRGPRTAPSSFRTYPKKEDGLECTRFEWVMRARELRKLNLNSIDDFLSAPWFDLASKRFRFVELKVTGRETDRFEPMADIARRDGIHAALDQLNAADRKYVLTHRLRPTRIQSVVDELLRRLDARFNQSDDTQAKNAA